MALTDLLRDLRGDTQWMANVMAWRTQPAFAGRFAALPPSLSAPLHAALHKAGIEQLYAHQAEATALALQNQDLAIVTPTASGKTLCYTLPLFQTLLHDPAARALCLFPTKALAHDQLDELQQWRDLLCAQLPAPSAVPPNFTLATYDGDTPTAARSTIRQHAGIVLSNPDMLHSGILPYHTGWADFFAGLRYVVLDEMHTYRGVFGSHVANVLRRLRRICAHYGSQPQLIAASATIANPQQLAEWLWERPVTVISESGAPRGEKHILLYNPPLVDSERGVRRSSVLEAQELAARSVLAGVQTIVFARARATTELLLTYLRDRLGHVPAQSSAHSPMAGPQIEVRGYRGGYLPGERRAIEAGLRAGTVRAVVATNALELGIDIGQLQAAILCGYPGSIASAWQQMGRAGREVSLADPAASAAAILVATAGALDQYVIRHPEFLFEQSPEQALINPDNLMILVDHLRCAVFELPFRDGELFGASPFTADVLQLLTEQQDVQPQGGRWFWSGEGYPARRIGLRTTGNDNVIIQLPAPNATVIGAIERASAPLLLHEGAIYLHEGQSHRVDQLDLAQNVALVSPATVDYYTQASAETQIEILATQAERSTAHARIAHGDLLVQSQVISFRRIRRYTHEQLGTYPLDYPPEVSETSGYWFGILPAAQQQLEAAGLWYDSLNDYGPNWQEQRARVRQRDGYRCTNCQAPEPPGRQHDVHHRVPFRTFGYVPGLNEHYLLANRLENLTLLCRNCHRRQETAGQIHSGLDGLAYALSNLAPLYLMCDPRDLGLNVVRVERAHDAQADAPLPTIYLYERAIAGLGFATRLYELHDQLLVAARELVSACRCRVGCPGCVGPILEQTEGQLPTKQLTRALIDVLIEGRAPSAAAITDDVAFM